MVVSAGRAELNSDAVIARARMLWVSELMEREPQPLSKIARIDAAATEFFLT